jgi:hypothetical protein
MRIGYCKLQIFSMVIRSSGKETPGGVKSCDTGGNRGTGVIPQGWRACGRWRGLLDWRGDSLAAQRDGTRELTTGDRYDRNLGGRGVVS